MISQVKLRGWNPITQEVMPPKTINEIIDFIAGLGETFVANHEIVWERFIGKKDIHGVEIYEGDIVKVINKKGERGADHMQGIWEVGFDDDDLKFGGRAKDDSRPYRTLNWGGTESVEIIGSIHLNPELLDGEL